jgi:hypothetical protein
MLIVFLLRERRGVNVAWMRWDTLKHIKAVVQFVERALKVLGIEDIFAIYGHLFLNTQMPGGV